MNSLTGVQGLLLISALPLAAMTRVAGALTKSGEVMKLVNNLMKVPQLQRTMVEMARGGERASNQLAAQGMRMLGWAGQHVPSQGGSHP
jgi:hypothetical protein